MMQSLQESRLAEARALFEAGKKKPAQKVVLEILKQDPQHIEAWMLAARLAESKAQACQAVNKGLALAPNHPQARILLVKLGCRENVAGAEANFSALDEQRRRVEARRAANPSDDHSVQGPLLIVVGVLLLAVVGVFLLFFGEEMYRRLLVEAGGDTSPYYIAADPARGLTYRNALAPGAYRADPADQVGTTGRPQLVVMYRPDCGECVGWASSLTALEREFWGRVDFVYINLSAYDLPELKTHLRYKGGDFFLALVDRAGRVRERPSGIDAGRLRELVQDHYDTFKDV